MPPIPASQSSPDWFKPQNVIETTYFFNDHDSFIAKDNPRLTQDPAYRIKATNDATQDFIEAVRDDIRQGYGFVPFIGAGFSVTAGIPIISHLLSYLQRCICMVLGITAEDEENKNLPRWNPRTDSWPPFIDRSRATPKGRWVDLVRGRYNKELTDGGDSWFYQYALGMMVEWRSALDFLSRVSLKDSRINPDQNKALQFHDPDHGIVDACFREVMRNKRPSLNHHMLAALTGVLRIDLVLTTNFDNLTEKAFDEFRSPLTVFDVHMNDTLPDYAAVSRVRSIIKLHGSLRSLRADFSLDGPPTHEDRKIFRQYLSGRLPEEKSNNKPEPAAAGLQAKPVPQAAKNHLLLLGVSATEQRTIQFIHDALTLIPDLKVYWICHSGKSMRDVHDAFKKIPLRTKDLPRLRILKHTNTGLLFLHLYQSFRKSLPTNGTLFPSTTRLSIPPLPLRPSDPDPKTPSKVEDPSIQRHYADFRHELDQVVCCKWPKRLVVGSSRYGVFGVSSAAAEIFRKLEPDNNCLWLDMNDIHNVDDLFEAFQEAAFQRLSEADWTPLFKVNRRYSNDSAPHERPEIEEKEKGQLKEEIIRIINSSNQPWFLFVNAREIPGTNRSGYDEPNGWMDGRSDSKTDPTYVLSAEAFADLLERFVEVNDEPKPLEPNSGASGPTNNKITVVLLCNSADRDLSHLQTVLAERFAENPKYSLAYKHCILEGTVGEKTRPQVVVEGVIDWAFRPMTNAELLEEKRHARQNNEPKVSREETQRRREVDRCRFIQALASMQRPRHFSIAWAKVMNEHWTLSSQSDTNRLRWINDLEGLGLLRRMDGGFIWFQCAFRQDLRKCLALTLKELDQPNAGQRLRCAFQPSPKSIEKLRRWNATAHQAEIHLGLSTWCRKVFDASGVAPAVFEIVEHLCWSAECLVRYESLDPTKLRVSANTTGEKPRLSMEDRFKLATRRIDTARELLEEHLFLIQTQGHPGATLRRLEFIKDFWVNPHPPHSKALAAFIDERKETGAASLRKQLRVKGKAPATIRTAVRDAIAPWIDLQREIAKLQCTAAEVARAICREVSEDGDAFSYLRESGVRMLENRPLSKKDVDMKLEEFKPDGTHQSDELKAHFTGSDREFEMIRWWRWCSMLGNGSRSFEAASKSVTYSLQEAGAAMVAPGKPPQPDDAMLRDWNLPVTGSRETIATHKIHLETLHSIEVASFNLTLQAHTLNRRLALTHRNLTVQALKAEREKVSQWNDRARTFAVKGLEFVEQIQNSGNPSVDHDFELHWCKSRLLMMAGIAIISKREMKITSRHSMSFMGDAAACLNSTTPNRGRADLAIVELRRSEIRLHEASSEVLYAKPLQEPSNIQPTDPTVPSPEPFEIWTYDRLRNDMTFDEASASGPSLFGKQLEIVRKLRHDIHDSAHPETQAALENSLRIIRARTTDALRFLDRAEPILRERRRNVFWTTWYFERRLRAISLLLWVSAVETGKPIPILGLEAAMYKTETEPDALLRDALRMIRVDAFRIALVVLSYASCARALQFRLALEADKVLNAELRDRLCIMRSELVKAHQWVVTVKTNRTKFGGHQIFGGERQTNAAVDDSVNVVVDKSLERIQWVIDGIEECSL